MVGYFTPSLLSNIDLSPSHFHFISDDRTFAGYLMSGQLKNAEIKIFLNNKSGYDVELLGIMRDSVSLSLSVKMLLRLINI
ncbi:acetolactate decarboxylase [uncultured Flavobacterium sp.]|uniref:acetolactate decarboxylase n=1 Tax=uncultured Flavobacterium sp. TaxID=165435 RepID=UPI00345A6F15